ncbi:hypothetical protein CPB85DRAFT_383809 [Mucidula mucida]|nr:hypothetical protein CPB85DRAFT_383809 [Mucidula mucida]
MKASMRCPLGAAMFNCLCEIVPGNFLSREPMTDTSRTALKGVTSGCNYHCFQFFANISPLTRSDWTLDVTHPGVDAEEGWQYAHHFSDTDDQWTADKPPQLERLLTGGTASALAGSSRRSSLSSSSSRAPQTWVRRRRWVRVMRRRLDIPPLPFLQPDGRMYHMDGEGHFIPYSDDHHSDFEDGDGQELAPMQSNFFSSTQDYVGRARYLVGTQSRDTDPTTMSAIDTRRAIAKLERATMELRQGLLRDDDTDRKTQAEVLLNAYSRELERRRTAAGAHRFILDDDEDAEDEDDDSDEEFHYPGSPALDTMRSSSRNSNSTTDYFSRASGSSRLPPDLTPQLSQAPDFRVPTHEAPQKVARWTSPSPHQIHQWEKDEDVLHCRECQRRFTFLSRRHCRRCGRFSVTGVPRIASFWILPM